MEEKAEGESKEKEGITKKDLNNIMYWFSKFNDRHERDIVTMKKIRRLLEPNRMGTTTERSEDTEPTL